MAVLRAQCRRASPPEPWCAESAFPRALAATRPRVGGAAAVVDRVRAACFLYL